MEGKEEIVKVMAEFGVDLEAPVDPSANNAIGVARSSSCKSDGIRKILENKRLANRQRLTVSGVQHHQGYGQNGNTGTSASRESSTIAMTSTLKHRLNSFLRGKK